MEITLWKEILIPYELAVKGISCKVSADDRGI